MVNNNTKISEYQLGNENKYINNKSKWKPSSKDYFRLSNFPNRQLTLIIEIAGIGQNGVLKLYVFINLTNS